MVSNPATWSVSSISERLRSSFALRYPDAAEMASVDPREAVLLMSDVEMLEDFSLRSAKCPIDGTYDPEPPRIRYRPHESRRDNFTLLHEVAHHLLAQDMDWCYTVAPQLDLQRSGAARAHEEDIANTFAADVLISPELAAEAFHHGVTSSACVELFERGAASATACLVRGLKEPGDRLVMLSDHDGQVWFSASNGEPFNPGRGVQQPAIADGVTRALNDGSGSTTLVGGEGLRFKSGKTFTAVRFDITVHGALAFVIVEPDAMSTRTGSVDTYNFTCPECGEEFVPQDSRVCQSCGEPKCPRCRACSCKTTTVICDNCFIALPLALAATGALRHDEC